jgi:hypothetical protein
MGRERAPSYAHKPNVIITAILKIVDMRKKKSEKNFKPYRIIIADTCE